MKNKFVFFQIIQILILFLIWELLSKNATGGLSFLPSPFSVFSGTPQLVSEYHIIKESVLTLQAVFISLFISSLIGYIISISMYLMPVIYQIIEPIIIMLGALPKVSLAPIIIILTGFNTRSVLIISILFTLPITIISLTSNMREIANNYTRLMLSLNASIFQKIRYLVLPYLIPTTIILLKSNIGLCFTGVIIGEMQIGKQGLGFLLYYGLQTYRLDLMILIIIILALLSYTFYLILQVIQKLLDKKYN